MSKTYEEKKDRWIHNLLVARVMMEDIDEKAINLDTYTNLRAQREGINACGAAACFGGYVALHPFFQKQGVRPDPVGAPVIPSKDQSVSCLVSQELFGDDTMFGSRLRYGVSQKREVLDRIDDRLEELLS